MNTHKHVSILITSRDQIVYTFKNMCIKRYNSARHGNIHVCKGQMSEETATVVFLLEPGFMDSKVRTKFCLFQNHYFLDFFGLPDTNQQLAWVYNANWSGHGQVF